MVLPLEGKPCAFKEQKMDTYIDTADQISSIMKEMGLAKSIINDYWHKEGWQVPLNLDKDLCISFNDYERQTGKRLLKIIPSSAQNTKAEAIIEALEQGYIFIDKDEHVWYSKEEALGSIEDIADAIKSIRNETQFANW